MRINTNMAALNTWRSMTTNQTNMQKSLERLSSGNRINRAADDAAGLAVSEKMRAQIRGTNQAIRNAQDGIGLLQTAEGGASVIQDMVQRMRELASQASNGTLDNTDRSKLNEEFQALVSEIDRTSNATTFNGKALIDGSLGSSVGSVGAGLAVGEGITSITSSGASAATYTVTGDIAANTMTVTNGTISETVNYGSEPTGMDTKRLNFSSLGITIDINAALDANIAATNTFAVTAGTADIQVGPNASDKISIDIADLGTGATALNLTGLDLNSAANAATAIGQIDTAIGTVSTERAKMGATQNRFESAINALQTQSENLTAAESRIRDVDMAAEMANFTKFQVLGQASTTMLAQANQLSQGILTLLR